MVVFILERTPASIRGDLTKWLLEPKAGVFLGLVSAEVRERLWEHVVRRLGEHDESDASAVMVYSADNEQGFSFRIHGDPTREVVDFEGLELVRHRPIERAKA